MPSPEPRTPAPASVRTEAARRGVRQRRSAQPHGACSAAGRTGGRAGRGCGALRHAAQRRQARRAQQRSVQAAALQEAPHRRQRLGPSRARDGARIPRAARPGTCMSPRRAQTYGSVRVCQRLQKRFAALFLM
jgi:hypothetical protein